MLQLQAKSDEQRIRRDLSSTTAEINKRLAEEKRLRDLQVGPVLWILFFEDHPMGSPHWVGAELREAERPAGRTNSTLEEKRLRVVAGRDVFPAVQHSM
jgi:hypothetical protein